MVDSGRKKTFIDKLLFVLKPKKSRADIVDYAEKIIDDYTGRTAVRKRQRQHRQSTALWFFILVMPVLVMLILCYALKIFL